MKKLRNLLMILVVLMSFNTIGQLPYSWTIGSNPGWTSSAPSNNTLGWQSCVGSVSTSNCSGSSWYRYDNGQNTTYTSPLKNTTCTLSSQVRVSFTLDINLENTWDFLDLEYSLNSGTTWILLTSYTGSWYGLQTYMINESPTTQFRFRFRSDGSVNSYCSWWDCSIYYADILSFNVDCISVLPVELIDFTSTCYNDNVILNWSTASEKNSDKFIVEKSRYLDEWVYVTEIQAQGNSNTIHNYNYYDDSWNGISYYRLRQIDFNGQEKIYGPISNECNRLDMEILPNPNNGNFNANVYTKESYPNSNITITDMLGKVIENRNIDIVNGTNLINFELNIESGSYIIYLLNNNENILIKHFIIK